MFTYVTSSTLSRAYGSSWTHDDISSLIVESLFERFSKVYINLSHPDLTETVWVDLESLRSEYGQYSKTLSELLVEHGDRSFNYTSPPLTQPMRIRYNDAFRAKYAITPCRAGYDYPATYPRSELPDLHLTRPLYNTDITLIHTRCLVTVNGFLHMTDTDGEKTYVYKGHESLRKSNDNQLGIISFNDIGRLTKLPIKPADIVKYDPARSLKDLVYLKVPESTEGKSLLLSIGGYLVTPEPNVFWQVSDDIYALNLKALCYIERIYEANLYLQMDIGLSESHVNKQMINLDEAWSDEVITRYLTLSQSFFILVDCPRLVFNKIYIRQSNLPGYFTSYQDPMFPLVVNYGKMAEYWKVYDDGYWAVTVRDSFLKNFIFTERPQHHLNNVTDQMNPENRFYHSRGYLLEIAGYQI